MTAAHTFKRFTLFFALILLSAAALAQDVPKIGLIYTQDEQAKWAKHDKDPLHLYRSAIEQNGGEVVVLGEADAISTFRERLESLDGVIIPGGADVAPKFYGQDEHEKLEDTFPELDRLEFAVLDHAVANELPVLGICRGHQLMNVYFGGTLVQDIPTEWNAEKQVTHRFKSGEVMERVHPIEIDPDSRLFRMIGVKRLDVTSYHHQAVLDLAPGFRITARSDDGLAEAIERVDGPFMVGVQFHPEKMVPFDPRFNALFAELIAAAKEPATAQR